MAEASFAQGKAEFENLRAVSAGPSTTSQKSIVGVHSTSGMSAMGCIAGSSGVGLHAQQHQLTRPVRAQFANMIPSQTRPGVTLQHPIIQPKYPVEYHVLRIGPECCQPGPTDEAVREIQKTDTRVSGTAYGTHYAMRVTHKKRLRSRFTTPVMFAEKPDDTSRASQGEHNP